MRIGLSDIVRPQADKLRRLLPGDDIFELADATAVAQEHPAVAAQPNSVFVGADGKFEANPDTALLQFTISA